MFTSEAASHILGAGEPYVPQAGTNTIVVSNLNNMLTDVKNVYGWNYFTRPTPINNTTWFNSLAVYGNSSFLILNGKQRNALPTSGPFGYRIKAGEYMKTITPNETNPSGTFFGFELRFLVFQNGVFVVAGFDGAASWSDKFRVITSTDGLTWTNRTLVTGRSNTTSGVTANNGFIYAFYNNLNVANTLYRSTDGVTWTGFNSPVTGQTGWNLSALNNLLFATKISDATKTIYISSNQGSTWSSAVGTGTTLSFSIVPTLYANGVYIYNDVNYTNYYTSTNGYNWTSRTRVNSIYQMNTIANKFVGSNADGSRLYESINGVTWTLTDTIPALNSGVTTAPGAVSAICQGIL